MAKGRRRTNRARTRQRGRGTPPGSGRTQPDKKAVGQGSGGVAGKRVNTGPQEPQFEWVMVEHRDADGNPTLPRELIAGTYRRRFEDVPCGTEVRVHVLAGYKPNALMMVEQKIYEIHRMLVGGWRRIGQIAVEMEGWREHEGDWFKAMRGARLEISNPGLPGPHNEKSGVHHFGDVFSSEGREVSHARRQTQRDEAVRRYPGHLGNLEVGLAKTGIRSLEYGVQVSSPAVAGSFGGWARRVADRSITEPGRS